MITGTGTSTPIESYYELKSKQMLCTVHVICICSKGYKNLHEGRVKRNELMTNIKLPPKPEKKNVCFSSNHSILLHFVMKDFNYLIALVHGTFSRQNSNIMRLHNS